MKSDVEDPVGRDAVVPSEEERELTHESSVVYEAVFKKQVDDLAKRRLHGLKNVNIVHDEWVVY